MAADSSVVQTVATQSDGTYSFVAVAPGTYMVEFVAPAGMEFVWANRRSDDTIDSDADFFSGRTALFAVDDGTLIEHLDAGLRTPLQFPWHNALDSGDVDDTDLASFVNTFGLGAGDEGFLGHFDADGSGAIDALDLVEFLRRYVLFRRP